MYPLYRTVAVNVAKHNLAKLASPYKLRFVSTLQASGLGTAQEAYAHSIIHNKLWKH